MEALEEDLLVLIFARLPTLSLLSLRCVCHQWRSLLSPNSKNNGLLLSHLHSLLSPPLLGFLIMPTTPTTDPLFAHTGASAWSRLPLFSRSPSRFPLSPVAASRGLLCFQEEGGRDGGRLLVCNPCTQVWRRLPRGGNPADNNGGFLLVGIASDCSNGRLRVVVVGSPPPQIPGKQRCQGQQIDLPAKLFDSHTGCWREVPPAIQVSTFYTKPVVWRGSIVWLSRNFLCKDMLIFDVELERWRNEGARWPEDCVPYHLWEWNGNLMLVGENNKSLAVWQFNKEEDGFLWSLMHVFSQDVVDMTRFSGVEDVAAIANFVCVMLVWAQKGLLLDISSGKVSWLPYCPLRAYDWGKVLPFQGTFDTIA